MSAAAHLGVELQPLWRDGGERDLSSTLSHSLCNLAVPQQLRGLPVDLQQHVSILHACSLCWASALQLLQNMGCCAQGRYSGGGPSLGPEGSAHVHVRPEVDVSGRRTKPKPLESESSWSFLAVWGRLCGTPGVGRMGVPCCR